MTHWQVRLAIQATILLIISVVFAAYVWNTNVDRAHEGRVQDCIAINELSRKLYVTLRDLGYSEVEARKFKPTLHCEDVP